MPDARIKVIAENLTAAVFDQVRADLEKNAEQSRRTSEEIKGHNLSSADSFDTLKEYIEHPLEGLKEVGAAFGENIVGAGGEAVAVIGAIGGAAIAGGAALVELAAHAREVGAQIHDMHEVTGMSVPAVSELKFAFEAAGSSIEQANNLVFQFEARMETSGKKVDDGLRAIGLSLEQIKEMPADERILAISSAMRSAGEDTNLAAVSMELFGKQGRDNLPILLKPLDDLIQKSKDVGAVWSKEDAQAADDFEVSLSTLKATSSAAWTQLGLHVSIADEFTYGYNRMKLAVANVALSAGDLATGFGWVGAAIDTLRGKQDPFPGIKKTAEEAAAALKKAKDDAMDAAYLANNSLDKIEQRMKEGAGLFKPITLSAADLKETEKQLDDQAKAHIETVKKQVAENEKLRKAHADVSASMSTLSGAQVEAIRYYHDQQQSVSEIAKVLGIYESQVRQVIAADTDAAKAAAELARFRKEATAALQSDLRANSEAILSNLKIQNKATEDAASAMTKATSDATDRQLADVDRWVQDEKSKLDERAPNYQQSWDAIQAAAAVKVEAIFRDSNRMIGPAAKEGGKTAAKEFAGGFSQIADDIPGILMRSFEGGGGLDGAIQSIGADIGSKLGTKIVTMIPGSMTSLFGSTVGGWMDTMLPGIGGMLGSFLGKGIDALMNIGGPSKAEVQGRQIEAAFEKGFGGFDAMMAKVGEAYNATGRSSQAAQADVARLMAAEKQGGDAVQAVIDEINKAFDEQKSKVNDLAATEKTASEARTAATQKATAELDAMMQHRQSLADSISGEAPEEVMGVIESQTRSQMAVLDKQIDEQRASLQEQAAAAAAAFEGEMGGINPQPIGVPYYFYQTGPGLPSGPANEAPESFAGEGFDLRRPTLAVVGDNPLQSESVLHASTVKDIVRAARKAGSNGGAGSEATTAAVHALRGDFSKLSDKLEEMMRTMPIAMKHAMRGAY